VPLAVKKTAAGHLDEGAVGGIAPPPARRRSGTRVDVMVDGPIPSGTAHPKGTHAVGRTRNEAPEVDGHVFLKGRDAARLEPGTIVQATVTDALDYDYVVAP
jgi:hypothetical protein